LLKSSACPILKRRPIRGAQGQDDFWLNIGAAFMHQDGEGFNIVLQALPLNGKIVLRPPKDDKKDNETERTQAAVRDINDRRRSNNRRDK
jgi:hypothetical protein